MQIIRYEPGQFWLLVLIMLVVTALMPGVVRQANAAAITFNTALPVSKDEWIARGQLVLSEASDDIQDVNITEWTLASVLGYGVTSKWSVFGVLPTRYIQRDSNAMRDSDFGLGDATLFSRYEVWRADQPGRTMRLSPFAGVRLPTGADGRTGDGSVDVFGGLIFTLASVDYVFDTQLSYTENRRADGFSRGDQVRIDSSFQYRLLPAEITRTTTGFLFGVLELNFAHNEDNRISAVIDQNSGGYAVSLTPGLQYATRRWLVDLAVQIPLHNAGDNNVQTDYSVLTSLRLNF